MVISAMALNDPKLYLRRAIKLLNPYFSHPLDKWSVVTSRALSDEPIYILHIHTYATIGASHLAGLPAYISSESRYVLRVNLYLN